MELQSLIPCITPHVTHHVISNPTLSTHSLLAFFHFLRTQHSHIQHKPDLEAHVILLSRLFEARKFVTMKSILNGVITNRDFCSPFWGIVSLVGDCEPRFVKKVCDMLFRVCSDNRLLDYVNCLGMRKPRVLGYNDSERREEQMKILSYMMR